MNLRISTELDAPAEQIWALMQRKETLLYVCRGLLGMPGAKAWPAEWRPGEEVQTRLWFMHVVPGWQHHIRVDAINGEQREMRTEENGGIVRSLHHRLSVEPLPGGHSRYSDALQIDAGGLTLLVWVLAQPFYRYRQARWRGLARVIA